MCKIFHKACELLDTKPEDVLHVGDHPSEDVIGAEEAGLQSAWMNRFDREWPFEKQPSAELHNLNDLVEFIEIKKN